MPLAEPPPPQGVGQGTRPERPCSRRRLPLVYQHSHRARRAARGPLVPLRPSTKTTRRFANAAPVGRHRLESPGTGSPRTRDRFATNSALLNGPGALLPRQEDPARCRTCPAGSLAPGTLRARGCDRCRATHPTLLSILGPPRRSRSPSASCRTAPQQALATVPARARRCAEDRSHAWPDIHCTDG